MKHNENIDVSGHLKIYKVYKDGTEEEVFDDHNIITSGMGVGLGLLYSGFSGAADITNFQIRYFQLGVAGDTKIDSYGVSETLLASALGQVNGTDDYATDSESSLPLHIGQLMNWKGGLQLDSQGTASNWVYGVIADNSIKRVDLNSVTYILYVDRNSCNDQVLNEIGLFMKNPGGQTAFDRSGLVAYRPFNNITKTSDFSLVFKWTLNF
tara:strand:+ start:1084 stop:1713 length:630 start_codon:yes stop_codon:yes gene_type:complete